MPSNAYMVLEFDIARYQLEMRRPLFGTQGTFFAGGPLDCTLISSFALDAEAGGTYYLRHDELNPPPLNEQAPTNTYGAQAIGYTRLTHPTKCQLAVNTSSPDAGY